MEDAVFNLHAELEDRHWWFEGRRRIVERIIARLMAPSPNDRIVDVGCGTGGTVAALGRRWSCLGLDGSALAIDFAKAKYPGQEFRLGRMPDDLRDLASGTALYLLMDVLEHIPDDRAFLADLVGMARPGAHILITVPADPKLWSGHDEMAEHLRRYTRQTLEATWGGLPVKPRLVGYFNGRLYPLILAARMAGRLLGGTSGRDGTDFALPPAPLNRLLTSVFGGEADRVAKALDAPDGGCYRYGVSLMAVLRKDE
jgi:SAM-dependent methyltransferase